MMLTDSTDEWAYGELLRRVRLAPGRDWAERYLRLIGRLVTTAELGPDDPRLAISMPGARQKSPLIHVNVNNRWVLTNYARRYGFHLGIIYGPEYEYQPELTDYVQEVWPYAPQWGERSAMTATPYYLRLRSDLGAAMPEEMVFGWLDATVAEARRAKGSPYRKYHQPVVYAAAMDEDFRARLMNEAFV